MPMPDAKFTFEYRDKNGKVRRIECTPLEFAKIHAAPFNPASHISLINDPRNAYGQLYTVKHLGNVYGARPVLYVNAPSSTLLDVVVARIKQGEPVWFGCDVGACSDSTRGLMDPSLRDYKAAFGTTLGLTKSERLQTGDSSMTQCVCDSTCKLTRQRHGLHGRPPRRGWSGCPAARRELVVGRSRRQGLLPLHAGLVRRLRLPDCRASRHGVRLQSREIADRRRPKELREVFEHGTPHVLPPWDPCVAKRVAGLTLAAWARWRDLCHSSGVVCTVQSSRLVLSYAGADETKVGTTQ